MTLILIGIKQKPFPITSKRKHSYPNILTVALITESFSGFSKVLHKLDITNRVSIIKSDKPFT